MDQIKEILRQAIKYRFWIAVGISALLPMIAYAVGSGPIKTKAETETQAILAAKKGVEAYSSGVLPNDQYRPIVDEQKEVLSKDVNKSWEKLYQRQAPLLTWPETVEKQFHEWGNKWPENVDASAVRIAVINYATAYPNVVSDVYKTFRPFDAESGEGVVSAPPEAVLLKPAELKLDGTSIPPLGKVWAAQERLWIQRSLLEVINEVNKSAKDWDTAKIKQINVLDVGTPTSQDQVSMAGSIELQEAPPLDPPGTEAAAAPAPAEGGDPTMMGMMTGGAQNDPSAVFYIKTDSVQYKIMPFQLSVLIEQNNIQDMLVALENSPMAIQVSEFAIAKPATRVTKPVKGDPMMWGGEGMMYGNRMMTGAMGNMTGFGGSMMPGGMGMNMGTGPMGGLGKRGIDARSKDRRTTRLEELEKAKKTAAYSIHDPYFSIIELTVYGQARFYNAPPPEPPAEPSQSAEAAPAEAAPAEATTPPGDMPTPETPAAPDAAKKDEAPKPEDAAKKDEAPKPEDAAKKDEAPKPEDASKKDEAPKPDEAPKDEPAKADSAAPKTQ